MLRDALKATKKIGLGQLVARGQASIVALRAAGKGLVIETVRYADELQNPEQFFTTVPAAKPEKELLSLATELIERKVKPFDPKAFKNQYETALRELIDAKLENRPAHEIDEPQLGGKVIDLMEALKRSVRERQAASGGKASANANTSRKAAAASAPTPTKKGKPRAKSTKKKPAKTVKASARGRRAA